MWGWHDEMMGGWGIGFGWMIIIWVIVMGLIVWGIIALVTHSSSEKVTSDHRKALDIAKERDAKGEISKEEFERIKKDLS